MPNQDTDLDLVIDAAVRERAPAGEGHLQPDEILAYYEGKRGDQASDAIRERLVDDPDAVRALLDLEALERMEAEETALAEGEVNALWQGTRDELVAEGLFGQRPAGNVVSLPLPSGKSEPDRTARPRAVYVSSALAATFLLAALGLGAWNLALLRALNRPHAAGKVETLAPADTATREEGAAVSHIGPTDVLLLDLERPYQGTYAVRLLVLEEKGSRMLWRGNATTDEYGNVTLEPPRQGYARGSYQIDLAPHEDGQEVTPSVSFRFVVD